ncbi:MAG: cation-translocating P-type ATPase [Bacteroidaceae bacterium]
MGSQLKYNGLSEEEVRKSRLEHGDNQLSPPVRVSAWKLFLEKFDDPVIKILLLAAFLSLFMAVIENNYMETVGIILAIILATALGFYFEYDAGKKFDLLNAMSDEKLVTTYREGGIQQVFRKDIVVGDIVMVEAGDEIPADGKIIQAISLQIDESSLTGEPLVDKWDKEENIYNEVTYSSNRLLRGSTVMNGHAVMRVDRVGDCTEIGQVAHQASQPIEKDTPLKVQLERLAYYISIVGISVSFLLFLILYSKNILLDELVSLGPKIVTIGFLLFLIAISMPVWLPKMWKEKISHLVAWTWIGGALLSLLFLFLAFTYADISWVEIEKNALLYVDESRKMVSYFMVAVALIVVSVPEGLPMSVTLSLALNMRRMLSTNNLVRKMHASETMGAISVICVDKTGTLTRNHMTVRKMQLFGDELFIYSKATHEQQLLVAENIAINSTAFLEAKEQNSKGVGNPTEIALLQWMDRQGVSYLPFREEAVILEQLPFSSERKIMATIVDSPQFNRRVLYIKGASEIVMGLCSWVMKDGEKKNIQTEEESIANSLVKDQSKGMRTLALAYYILEEGDTASIDELIAAKKSSFYGLIAIEDPIRKEVPAAIQQCLHAGVQVKIVTGDTMITAKNVAVNIGLWKAQEDTDALQTMTGKEFAAMSDSDLLERIQSLKILSRARPLDKQRLVALLKQKGEVVAVTGDGTNDAPALHHAHVGLSMGSGTSVAKEASDITIMDDSFASISYAIKWGRSLYKNIQRFIGFQLTINFVALVALLTSSFLGTEPLLTVTQMLWVNLIMDTLAALAISTLPPSDDVMQDSPRNNNDFIITRGMFTEILRVGVLILILLTLFYLYLGGGAALTIHQMTQFFSFFVLLQFWRLASVCMSCKCHSIALRQFKPIFLVLLLILLGQIGIVTFGAELFRTVPLSLNEWVQLFSLSASIVLLEWIGKQMVSYYKRKKTL